MKRETEKNHDASPGIQVFRLYTTRTGMKFIPFHHILHCNYFESGYFYHIVASAMSGTVTAERCTENDYPGYDLECVSHDTLIDVTENLKNVHINKDNSITFLSPENGSLECYFSRCYFQVSDNSASYINIVVKKMNSRR